MCYFEKENTFCRDPQEDFPSHSFIFFLILFIWLCWVFVAARAFSLVMEIGGYSPSWGLGFSLKWLLLLRSSSSRAHRLSSCGSQALENRLNSCPVACGILQYQGLNFCLLHFLPLSHQGRPPSQS